MTQSTPEIVCMTCGETLHHATKLLRGREAEIEQLQAQLMSLENEVDHLQGPFIASRRRSTFHRIDCTWAQYLNEYNATEFDAHWEAVEAGYKPCKTCRS